MKITQTLLVLLITNTYFSNLITYQLISAFLLFSINKITYDVLNVLLKGSNIFEERIWK